MYKEPKKRLSGDARLYIKVFVIAFVVSAIFFLPSLFGDRGIFLFYGDYNVQQIPFYQLAHRAIREGNIGFNFYTDLGVNFIGSYSFYLLGSPFFWLTLPFPNVALPYLMAPLFWLKFATAATTACAYIKRFVTNKNYAIIGGLLYAFSGFGIYNIFFNHFHEVIAFFPLILLSLEMYVEDGKKGPFAFSVFLCSLCNYFFFFGEVVFVIIYFFVRIASSKTWRLKFSAFLGLALEAVLGLLMAAVILVPAIITVLGNPRLSSMLDGWNLLVYSNEQRYFAILECLFFPPDIPARPNFFPDANAKWSSLGAWLPLLSMTGVITFMQTHKRNFIRRMLGISLFMALIPGLNSFYFALNDAYYGRWFFMPILLMALATVISLEKCTTREFNTGIRWTLLITLCFCSVGLVPKRVEDGVEFGLVEYPERFWVYVLIAVLSIFATAVLINVFRHKKNFTKIVTALVCVVTVIYSVAFISMGKAHSYNEDFIIDNAIYGGEKISLPNEDDEFFRIDVYDGMDNLPMFWGYPSIQAFHSIVPESVMSFYPEIGVERGVASRPEPEQYALRTLTSCKYLFIEAAKEDPIVCYGFNKIDTQNGFDIYENEYYIPMGFAYDTYCTQEYYEGITESYRARLMVQAILLSDEQLKKYDLNLIELKQEDSFLAESTMPEDVEVLRKNCADSFVLTNTGFKSSITLDKGNLVFYSVPYDDGWSATVNGKKVDVERVNSGFVAVYAEAGENEIVFTYETPGLKMGVIISVVSLLVLLIYLAADYIYHRRHPIIKDKPDELFDELSQMLKQPEGAPLSVRIHSADELYPDDDEPLRFDACEDEATEPTSESVKTDVLSNSEQEKGSEEN